MSDKTGALQGSNQISAGPNPRTVPEFNSSRQDLPQVNIYTNREDSKLGKQWLQLSLREEIGVSHWSVLWCNGNICSKLTCKETANLPDPPLKADHTGTGNGQLHVGVPGLQTVCGPACRWFQNKMPGWTTQPGFLDLLAFYIYSSVWISPPHVCL